MIKISLANINAFLQAEAQIKSNELYTFTEFCRIEALADGSCSIVRTSMNAWVFFKTKCEPGNPATYLVDDRILRGFTTQLKEGSEIEIYSKGEQLYIKSGKQEIKHQLMEVAKFPEYPDKKITGVRADIPSAVIKSIKTAMAYTKQLQYDTAFSFVALSPSGDVFGSNGNFVYLKKFDLALPNVLIGAEASAVLDSETDYKYMDNESYYFFMSDTVSYGFVKTQLNRINYAPLVNAGNRDQYFTVKTEDIIKFCGLCIAAAKELVPAGTLSDKLLSYSDQAFNIDVRSDIEIGGNIPVKNYQFNTQTIRKIISVLPYKTLNFSPVGDNLIAYADEDQGYIGVFSGTALK